MKHTPRKLMHVESNPKYNREVQVENSVERVTIFYNYKEDEYWISLITYNADEMTTSEIFLFQYQQHEKEVAEAHAIQIANALDVLWYWTTDRKVWVD